VPVTTALRTAFDLARHLDLTDAVAAVDAMLTRRWITITKLAEYAAKRPGWSGAPRVRRVLELSLPGAESPMESRVRLLLVLAGLPIPVPQYKIRDSAGRLLARLDLAYPELRLAIEYDGDHHRERDQFRRDLARLNRLRLLGWTVLQFTADDVLRHPERVVNQVRAAIARCRAAAGA
jgi:hypothetical protein